MILSEMNKQDADKNIEVKISKQTKQKKVQKKGQKKKKATKKEITEQEKKEKMIVENPEYVPMIEDELGSSSIIHLKIHSTQLNYNNKTNFNNTNYESIEPNLDLCPSPYDPASLDNYYINGFKETEKSTHISLKDSCDNRLEQNAKLFNTDSNIVAFEVKTPYKEFYYDIIRKVNENSIMVDFQNSDGWPVSTTISCMWCCHEFDTPPCGIPQKYVDGKYYLTGCFCSYNCVAAEILGSHETNKWQHYSLLHSLFKSIHDGLNDIIIRPAPSRLLLKKFGGIYSIEEYRENLFHNSYGSRIMNPPLIFISPKIYEFNTKKDNDDHDYIFKE